MIDNHGHIGVGEIDPEDIVEGYDPEVLRGQSPRQFISLMDAIGVELAVLHSLRPWANKHHARVLREHPGRFIGVCKIDEATVTTDEAHEALRTCVEDWGFKALYFDPAAASDAADNFHTQDYVRFWEFVASLRIPVCFVSLRRNFETLWPRLLRLLDRLPQLTAVIVHGLYPACLLTDDHRVTIPDSALTLVRDFDVQLDLLPGLRENQYGPNDEVLRALFDTFGPSRLLWGSEFTKVKSPTVKQYRYQAHYVRERFPSMSDDDLRQVMGDNARRVYGLR